MNTNPDRKGIHESDQGILRYIGDSVYAIGDRSTITLRLDHHENTEGQIILDAYLIRQLEIFISHWREQYGT